MPSRRFILLCVLGGAVVLGGLGWKDFASRRQRREVGVPTIEKQPATFTSRTFDPAAPPADLPPLTPGENAECESNFLSNASVAGETRQTDATHATVTVTQIKMTLQLNITIWVPVGVTQRVIEHEGGHRRISEYYYRTAGQIARRIAANYMGKQVDIAGADLNAESGRMLHQIATEITDSYGRELNPEPTQLLYDAITDHSRNDVVVQDAVAHAIKNAAVEASPPLTNPEN